MYNSGNNVHGIIIHDSNNFLEFYIPLVICNGGGNQPPNIPSSPVPTDRATAQAPILTLVWIGGDPDCGDAVSYDVYFGTTNPPATKVADHQSTLSYTPETLAFNTAYYWQIIAWDEHNLSNPGPVWKFTTGLVWVPGKWCSSPQGPFKWAATWLIIGGMRAG